MYMKTEQTPPTNEDHVMWFRVPEKANVFEGMY